MIEVSQHQDVAAGGVKDDVAELEQALNQPLTDFDGSYRAELNAFVVFDEQSPASVSAGFSDGVNSADHFQVDIANEGKDADTADQADERDVKINRAPGPSGDHPDAGQAND